ncbi:hypothetical protein H9P43_003182 [Blastocladiella emersonii ATCC 22665]|nr:hypothetical protein H9P43_003182 [Blastocladiella emersonii ATCC 22665]
MAAPAGVESPAFASALRGVVTAADQWLAPPPTRTDDEDEVALSPPPPLAFAVPLDRQLAEYILFPVFHRIRAVPPTKLPESLLVLVLRLFQLVWSRTPNPPAQLADGEVLQPVHDATFQQSLVFVAQCLAAPSLSEDVRLQSVDLLLLVLGRVDPAFALPPAQSGARQVSLALTDAGPPRVLAVERSKATTTATNVFKSQVGTFVLTQLYATLLDLIKQEKLLPLRLRAMVAIYDLLVVNVGNPDVIGFALPNTVSTLAAMCRSPHPNSQAIALALELLARLLVSALADGLDSAVDPDARWSALVAPPKPAPARPVPAPGTNPLAAFKRTPEWVQATAGQIDKFVRAILSEIGPDAAPVVLGRAIELCSALVQSCSAPLRGLAPYLFRFVATHTLSTFPAVETAARRALAVMLAADPTHTTSTRALDDALGQLGQLVLASDDDKLRGLCELRGCLEAAPADDAGSRHSLLAATMDKTLKAWSTLLLLDPETPLRSEVDAGLRQWNCLAFHQVAVADAVEKSIRAWAAAGGPAVAQAVLRAVVAAMHNAPGVDDSMVEDGPIALATPRRRHYSLLLVLNQCLAVAYDAAVFDEYLGLLETSDDPLTVALVLDGLAAASPPPQLTPLLRDHLATILAYSAASHRALHVCATACLDSIARQLDCTSLEALLDRAAPYLINTLHAQIRYINLNPQLPRMMRAVVRGAGAAAAAWFEDAVVEILAALSRHLAQPELWKEFTEVILELVHTAMVPLGPSLAKPPRAAVGESKPVLPARFTAASPWLKRTYGDVLVNSALDAENLAKATSPSDAFSDGTDAQAMETDPNEGADLDADGKSSLPHAAQVLLHILHHARNLVPAAPPRVRVELLRLATATLDKLPGYDRYTNPEIYRILQVVSLAPSTSAGAAAHAYIVDATLDFLAAAARQSPDYGADTVVQHHGSEVVAIAAGTGKSSLRAARALCSIIAAATRPDESRVSTAGTPIQPRLAHQAVMALAPVFLAPGQADGEDLRPAARDAIQALVAAPRTGDAAWMALAVLRKALVVEAHVTPPTDAVVAALVAAIPDAVADEVRGRVRRLDMDQVAVLDGTLAEAGQF